jgi:hypothetical protein
MSALTGRSPIRKAAGVTPAARTATANTPVTSTAHRNPQNRASKPSLTDLESRRPTARATAMIALYSGPTTMAPTTRICELVKMPTAAMRPAAVNRT